MALTVGTKYVLTEPFGQGIGALPAGLEVTVESLHEVGEAGIGGDVLISFPSDPVEVDGEQVVPVRRLALEKDWFLSIFEPAGDK